MKEIIINDVDVSGCENYSALEHLKTNNGFDEHPDFCCNYIDHICINHPNCYYKQLKRLEQENAELKENGCEQCKHLDLYIKYKQTLQEIKEKCEETRRTGRKAYLPIDILDIIKKVGLE